MVKTLHVTVNNKIASYWQRDGVIVCGNSDYVIEFTFDSEWDDHQIKTARFITASGFSDVVFEGTSVAVPIIQNTTSLTVGVFSGNLKTTTPAVIPCMKSILCGEGVPVDPPPDVYTQLMEKINGLEGGAEIPVFDLVALGLADIPLDGTAVKLETDTTEIMAALDAGAVRFHVKLEYNGVVIDMVSTMHDISSPTGGGYICSCAFDPVGGFPLLVNITIEDGSITAMCTALGAGTGEGETVEVPTSIDLSGLDPDENNEGVIVETYADSSTKETKLTYDESGNIVEIEDADGNVTTLTW